MINIYKKKVVGMRYPSFIPRNATDLSVEWPKNKKKKRGNYWYPMKTRNLSKYDKKCGNYPRKSALPRKKLMPGAHHKDSELHRNSCSQTSS